MTNMEVFNAGAALIFDTLYEAFPQRIHLDIYTLAPSVSEETRRLYSETVIFLASEGFLKYEETFCPMGENSYNIWFGRAVLTNKGLEILNRVPGAIEDKTTLGEKLSNAVKEGAKEIAKMLVGQIISAGASFYLGPTR